MTNERKNHPRRLEELARSALLTHRATKDARESKRAKLEKVEQGAKDLQYPPIPPFDSKRLSDRTPSPLTSPTRRAAPILNYKRKQQKEQSDKDADSRRDTAPLRQRQTLTPATAATNAPAPVGPVRFFINDTNIYLTEIQKLKAKVEEYLATPGAALEHIDAIAKQRFGESAKTLEEIFKATTFLDKNYQHTETKVIPPIDTSIVAKELNQISTSGLPWTSAECAAAMVDRWTVGLTEELRTWLKIQPEEINRLILSSGLSRVSRFGAASNDLQLASEACLINQKLKTISGNINKAIFATADGSAALQASIMGAPVVLVLSHPSQHGADGAYLGAVSVNPTLDTPKELVWLDFPTLEALSTRASIKRALLPNQPASSGQAVCVVFKDAEEALGRKWLQTVFVLPSSLLSAIENAPKDAPRYDVRQGFSPSSYGLKYGTRMSICASLVQLHQVGHLTFVVDDDEAMPVESQLEALFQDSVKRVVGFSSSSANVFPNATKEGPWDLASLKKLFSIEECVALSHMYRHRLMLVKAAGLY